MLAELLLKWPLLRQLRDRSDGTGADAMSDATKSLRRKNEHAKVTRSICPYCAVGCGQLIFHCDGKILSIEGDPESPVSRGHLCPKGAASFELVTHPGRLKTVKYRAPRSRHWTDMPLDRAMQLIAQRVWETRERTFDEKHMHTTGIAHLGGATLDNEEN
jgi:formate dehydrogenase major subunit